MMFTVGTVRRTWRERLFSWPWRPWQATKVAVTLDYEGVHAAWARLQTSLHDFRAGSASPVVRSTRDSYLPASSHHDDHRPF